MPLRASNGVMWQSLSDYRAAAAASLAELASISDRGPLPPEAIPLVTVVKNERILIDAFLRHYRRLGVGRFFIVDNGSTDGTLDVLSAAPDVDLWQTSASYRGSNSGRLWIEGLLAARASGRWAMHVDADEFLVFTGMSGSLLGLARKLQSLGETRLLAPMLDVYSNLPVRETVIAPGADPFALCQWFDPGPEMITHTKWSVVVRGGPRLRAFYAARPIRAPVLTKYPLFFFDDQVAFLSVHAPTPFHRNFLPVRGRLLHVKFYAGFEGRAHVAVDEREHWDNASQYRRYLSVMTADPDLNFHGPASLRLDGPQSLVAANLMINAGLSLRDAFDERA